MLFGGVDMPLMGGEIAHFHGVSRAALGDRLQVPDRTTVEHEMISRLRDVYGVEWPLTGEA